MMHIQMLSEAALPPCSLTGRTYTARAATCGHVFRLIIAALFSASFLSPVLKLTLVSFITERAVCALVVCTTYCVVNQC
jgi:hypothetical protein